MTPGGSLALVMGGMFAFPFLFQKRHQRLTKGQGFMFSEEPLTANQTRRGLYTSQGRYVRPSWLDGQQTCVGLSMASGVEVFIRASIATSVFAGPTHAEMLVGILISSRAR